MTLLDLVLAGSIVLAVVGGWRLGFLTRVLSWIGLAAGLLLGLEVLPSFLRQIDSENRTLVVLLALGLLVVAATLGQALGFVIGERLSPAVRLGGLGPVDRVLGALAGFAGAVVLLWLVIPVLAATPGTISRQTSGSAIARAVDGLFPQRRTPPGRSGPWSETTSLPTCSIRCVPRGRPVILQRPPASVLRSATPCRDRSSRSRGRRVIGCRTARDGWWRRN